MRIQVSHDDDNDDAFLYSPYIKIFGSFFQQQSLSQRLLVYTSAESNTTTVKKTTLTIFQAAYWIYLWQLHRKNLPSVCFIDLEQVEINLSTW